MDEGYVNKCPPEESLPPWMVWRRCPPDGPGWYWVCAEGMWPQVVEFVYVKGIIKALDRHTLSSPRAFWSMCAGPIPDPPAHRITKLKYAR